MEKEIKEVESSTEDIVPYEVTLEDIRRDRKALATNAKAHIVHGVITDKVD